MEKENKEILKAARRMSALHSSYDIAVAVLETLLKEKIEFEFSIFYQPSDGFVILHEEKVHNAPLFKCLKHIENNGSLSYYTYLQEAI